MHSAADCQPAQVVVPSWAASTLCACSGLGVSFCFWPYRTGFLAYFVLVPFIIFSGIRDGRGRFLLNSFIFGFAYFMGSLYWIAMLDREQIAVPWLRLPAAITLSAYLSVFMLLTGWAARRLAVLRIPIEVALALAWGAVEVLRSLGPLGFPWASIGYTQTPYVSVIQQAAVAGTYGLSAWLVLLNGLVTRFILTRKAWALVVGGLVFAVPVTSGRIVLRRAAPEAEIRLSLIQPNVEGSVKWDQVYRDSTMRLLTEMTEESPTAEMVVWPETAVPFHIKYLATAYEEVARLAQRKQAYLLFGVPDFERRGDDIRFFNSAILLGPEGAVRGEYRKIHLVPFGEMIPFEDRIAWLERIDLGEGDFSAGETYSVFEIDGRHFGVAICFESIYPELVGEFVRGGADFIVNITNDEWFGPSLGPYQHAQMAVMRSVEFRVGLARCANTGISMFVDSYGRITSSTELFKRRTLTGGVAVGRRGTVYAMLGRGLELGLLLTVLGLVVVSYLPWQRRGESV